MTATDILTGTGQTEFKGGTEMDLNNPKYAGLYNNGEHYWLTTAYNTSTLWYVHNHSGAILGNVRYGANTENGVRPVVSLKSNVKTSAMDTQGRWIIEIE